MPFAIKSSACDLFIFLYSAIPTGALCADMEAGAARVLVLAALKAMLAARTSLEAGEAGRS